MNNFLGTIIGCELPTADDIINQQMLQQQMHRQQMMQQQQMMPDDMEPGTIAQVEVILSENNDCKIVVNINEEASTPEEASAIGRMLYQLNEGHMKSTFANIILRQANSNIENTDFNNLVMREWEKYYKETDEEPTVRPSQALG